MEYNIGDKVRINQQLTFKSYDVVKSMQICYNKIAEIIDKQYDSFNNDFIYQLKIDGVESPYNWYEYMFEPLENKIRGFEVISDEFRKHPDVDIKLPKRGSSKSAGYDICTPVDIIIPPNGISDAIQTDIKAYMLDDEYLEIVPRSSIGFKKGLMLINTCGIIDSDYYNNIDNDGNIGFKFKNLTNETVEIKAGERILQGIFKKYLTIDNDDCDIIRTGGVGSSGKM